MAKHYCLAGWRRATDEAEERGSYRGIEKDNAKKWDMCAFAEARQRFPELKLEVVARENAEHLVGCPMDDELEELGCRFYEAVEYDDFVAARVAIDLIETRLGQLAKEQA